MTFGYNKDLDQKIEQYLNSKKITATGKKPVAVFDADGTLWNGDLGDDFFKYQRDKDLMPKAPEKGQKLLDLYVSMGHSALAYGHMALWNEGVFEENLWSWARDCWHQIPESRILAQQKQLVAALTKAGFEVWVVSASLWWVVAEGAQRHFGIPPERVLATRTKVKNGRLTGEWAYPVPYKGGKVDVIKSQLKAPLHLVSGNSMGDYEMMLLAQELVLVINTAKKDSEYYQTECEIREIAQKKPTAALWLVHQE